MRGMDIKNLVLFKSKVMHKAVLEQAEFHLKAG